MAAFRGPIGRSTEGPSGPSHASPPPRTMFHGPIGSSTEGPAGAVRMRQRYPGQRFVAPVSYTHLRAHETGAYL
eukprot:5472481-Pyramimonas_sp.AAC.1